jgi:hypothetical protein
MRDELSIARLGAPQHGVVTHAQLGAAGFTRHEIQHLLDSGRIAPFHRGVYRTSGSPTTWDERMLAATLYTGGVASHRAAAHLWGVGLAGMPPLALTVVRNRAPRSAGLVVHRSTDLSRDHMILRRGILTTSPLRMLVDLGAVVGLDEVAIGVDSLLGRRVLTIDGIEHFRHLLGGPGRSGAGVLGQVLASRPLGRDAPDSLLEPTMARLCQAHALEMP